MQREIFLKNDRVSYTLKKSKRAKHVRLCVGCDAKVSVTIPWSAADFLADDFILQKSDWLMKKINYFQNEGRSLIPAPNEKDYLKYHNLALEIVEKKVARYNDFYNFPFQKISVRNQKSRWGSCSREGNLSFNYRVIFLSEKLSDYVVIHELCHLKEFNHGKNFWALVEKLIPDYKEVRRKVRAM
jgi:predicted metal-dependent hydrolase